MMDRLSVLINRVSQELHVLNSEISLLEELVQKLISQSDIQDEDTIRQLQIMDLMAQKTSDLARFLVQISRACPDVLIDSNEAVKSQHLRDMADRLCGRPADMAAPKGCIDLF